MRVLHAVRPATGGMKNQVLSLCRQLRERGWTVEIACPADSDVERDARAAGIRVHGIDLAGPLHVVHDARALVQLHRIIRGGDFDIVHSHGFKAGLVGRVAGWWGGCGVLLLSAHNHVLYRDDISAFTKWRYRLAERMLAKLTTNIIAVSESLRNELVDAYGLPADLIVVVHNGVDTHEFLEDRDPLVQRTEWGVSADSVVVGSACRHAPQKGLHLFVEAAGRVSALYPSVRFVIGGDGPLRSRLEQTASARGLGSVLIFTGVVADMPAFLSGLDIYVSSSLSEGLPLSLVEVGAAALPIVATEVGGTPEVVRDGTNGLLVSAGDPDALVRGIRDLVDDTELRKRMGRAGRQIATTEFAPGRMADETLAVYENALRTQA